MDLIDLASRRRRFLFYAAASVVAGYGAYRLYHHPSVTRKRLTIARLIRTLDSLSDAAAFSADSIAVVSHDLNRYLHVGGEIPLSLRQLAQLASSGEVSSSISRVSQAVTLGVLLGRKRASPPDADQDQHPDLLDRVMDKILSKSGSEFASSVTGSIARNIVVGAMSKTESDSDLPESDPKWVKIVSSEPCKNTISDLVRVFVSTSVAVFLEKTMHLNTFDDIFSGLTNPKHEAKMKDLLVCVSNGAVETLIKTSHEVISKPKIESSRGESSYTGISSSSKSAEKGKWVETVSSTLAIPSNRKFMLDVTGRVTFETVRSFLEFLLWKVLEGARTGTYRIHEEVKDVIKYMSAKSMIVVTICFTLCMHVMASSRVLVPV